MITLRRAQVRHDDPGREREDWLTFYARDRADPLADGFGALEIFDEDRLPPGGSLSPHRCHHAEIVTYVREGALAYDDQAGGSGVIRAGEFQSETVGHGSRSSETNASRTEGAHVFRIWLRPPEAGAAPGREQKRFSAADRQGGLCVVASPDARRGSLRVRQDVLIYSAILDAGTHVVHELAPGRSAWLHVVAGEISLGDVMLCAGDGAGIVAERAISLTARPETEILLLDMSERPRSSNIEGGTWP